MKLGKKLLSICMVLIATLSLNICSPVIASAATKGSVTAKVLNVRSGPGKTYKKIGTLKKGSSVNVVSTKGGWKKVHFKNKTGYVYGKFVR